MMNYFLAIDQGTSSTRAILFNENGHQVAMNQDEISQYYPKDGWVEHSPEEIYDKTLSTIKSVISGHENAILGCGITNQRETTVIWDKMTGDCLYNAIVWQDRRTDEFCQSLQEHQHWIKQKTGLLLDPYFTASKLNWLLTHVSGARRLADDNKLAFGTIDSYLIWRLTNGKKHVTDITNASRTMLFDIHKCQWDDDLLALFDIPRSILPEVLPCDGDFGVIDSKSINLSIPISGVAGDQQAACIGQACFKEGMLKSTYGTGCFLLLNTGTTKVESKHNLISTIVYQIKDTIAYGLEGSIFNAGTAVKWLRDELALIEHANETERLASSIVDNGGVYMVPAFTGLGAPHWDSHARGAVLGIQQDTTISHIVRAALESVAYQTRDILDCMKKDSQIDIQLMRVDGGMAVNRWLLQFIANICDITVEKPQQIETTALGAAILAAIGIGYFENLEEAAAIWHIDERFFCRMEQTSQTRLHDDWLKAINKVRA
jgi:glycerol kinase